MCSRPCDATARAARGEVVAGRRNSATFMDGIRSTYDTQGHPFYASARLWDDGVIDPADTRRVLSLALSVACREPRREADTRFGIFRM